MADTGIIDELLIKVGVEVDDSKLTDLKKELANNKEQSIKLRPEKNLKGEGISAASNVDASNFSEKEILLKILESNKNSEKYLKEDHDQKQDIENKISNEEKQNNESGFSGVGIATAIAGLVTASYFLMRKVQEKYIEKLDRELNFSSLAYETGETADQMAKLNYESKNVGLNLNQVTRNAQSFFTGILTGQDEQKSQLLSAIGYNPYEDLKNIKTPQDAARVQAEIYEKVFKGLQKGGFPAFVASEQASEVSGIPADQAFKYQNLGTVKNLAQAGEIANLRGSVGSKEDILNNFQDLTTSLQKSTATFDRLLSAGNIARQISIETAELTAKTVNLINATLNIAGLGDNSNSLSKNISGFYNALTGSGVTHKPPSKSAQTKAGAN